MIFEVGKQYSNNNGEYIPLGIRGDVMRVRYHTGKEQTLSVAMQTRIYENRNLRQPTEQGYIRKHQEGYQSYWTLGFLANRIVHLGVNIITGRESEFRDQYKITTGKELTPEQIGISFLREGANQWGNQGVIAFSAKENELVLLKFRNTPYLTNQLNIFEVKDIHYFWFALENGFQIGGKQDISNIQKLIPTTDKDSFNKGLRYAKE